MQALRSAPRGRAFIAVWAALQLSCGARPEATPPLAEHSSPNRAHAAPDSLLARALQVIEAEGREATRAETNLTAQSNQLALMVRVLALAGEVKEAETMVRSLDAPERVKTAAYGVLAEGYLRENRRRTSARILDHMLAANTWSTSRTFASLVTRFRELGEEDEARRLLRRIPDRAVQAQASLGWVLWAKEHHQNDSAVEWAVATLERARNVPPAQYAGSQVPAPSPPEGYESWRITDHGARQSVLLQLLRVFREREESARVTETLQAMDQIDHDDKHLWMARARMTLATVARQHGAFQEAAEQLLEAKQRISLGRLDTLGDAQHKIRALIQIAEEQHGLGRAEEARNTLQEAERVAAGISNAHVEDFKFNELLALARAHITLGRRPEAERLVRLAEASLPTFSTNAFRKSVRAALAVTRHLMGDTEAADRHVTALREQIEEASAGTEPSAAHWMNEVTWSTVVDPFIEAGAIDHAEALLEAGNAEQAGYQEALTAVGTARLETAEVSAAGAAFRRAGALYPMIQLVDQHVAEGAEAQAQSRSAEVLRMLCTMATNGGSPWVHLLELTAVVPNPGGSPPAAWLPPLECITPSDAAR